MPWQPNLFIQLCLLKSLSHLPFWNVMFPSSVCLPVGVVVDEPLNCSHIHIILCEVNPNVLGACTLGAGIEETKGRGDDREERSTSGFIGVFVQGSESGDMQYQARKIKNGWEKRGEEKSMGGTLNLVFFREHKHTSLHINIDARATCAHGVKSVGTRKRGNWDMGKWCTIYEPLVLSADEISRTDLALTGLDELV